MDVHFKGLGDLKFLHLVQILHWRLEILTSRAETTLLHHVVLILLAYHFRLEVQSLNKGIKISCSEKQLKITFYTESTRFRFADVSWLSSLNVQPGKSNSENRHAGVIL